jgi:hypothetical protein
MSESKKENQGLKFDLMKAQEPSEVSDEEEAIQSIPSQIASPEIMPLDEEEKEMESKE